MPPAAPRLRPRVASALLVGLLAAGAAPARAEGEVELRRNLVTEAVRKARPAVVGIRTTALMNPRFYGDLPMELTTGLGSGVMFHPRGYVITNAHVISRASSLYVQREGHAPDGTRRIVELRAVPFAVDLSSDLAILRVVPEEVGGGRGPFPALRPGRSDDLMIGETVIAVGNAVGVGMSVTSGVIAALDRRLPISSHEFEGYIQTDAAINEGNSGGPLLDVTGRWIGVNTAILRRTRGGLATGVEGIAFAIPSDRVRRFVGRAFNRRLVTGEWIGIDEDEGPGGVPVVSQVFPKGPARTTPIRKGDEIVALDGKPTPTLYDYRIQAIEIAPGARVQLTLRREGRRLAAPVTLVSEPVPTDDLSLRHLGVVVGDIDDYEAGLLVQEVRPDGPAAKVGLEPQDVILSLGNYVMRNRDDLLTLLQHVQRGDLIPVKVRRTRVARGATAVRALDGMLRSD
jgi:serine protease Do